MNIYNEANVLVKSSFNFYHAHVEFCVMGTSTSNFERLFLGKKWEYLLIFNCNGKADTKNGASIREIMRNG